MARHSLGANVFGGIKYQASKRQMFKIYVLLLLRYGETNRSGDACHSLLITALRDRGHAMECVPHRDTPGSSRIEKK